MRVDDFDYELPPELIAQTPLSNRSDSRLLVVDSKNMSTSHAYFRDLQAYLKPGDVLVRNNSKVMPARLYGKKADTGAVIELLLLNHTRDDMTWVAMAKPAKRLKVGAVLTFSSTDSETILGQATVIEELPEGLRELRFDLSLPFDTFLNAVGSMPLPPYIHERLENPDRYQTVYAKHVGSVAAPTAGLHFTDSLIEELTQYGVQFADVTLHVGIGTFRSVQVDTVEEHQMHTERYEITPETSTTINQAKLEGRRVIAVGTTALRTLESATVNGELMPGTSDTGIFIYPGYRFQLVDGLITNFHLPKSTLFMLVSAWMGSQFAKTVYQAAVEAKYRFFSFGDAMFLMNRGETRNDTDPARQI